MKKWLCLAWVGAAMAVGLAAEPWSQRVTPEEFKAAGLDKLSPAELARLDALVGKYGPGGAGDERTETRQPAAQAEIEAAATRQAAVRVAEAEARAAKAEQEAAASREAAQAAKKNAEEGFFAKAKRVIVSPGTSVEVAAVETEIDGDFHGWEAMTTWRMKDGTTWRVENKPQTFMADRVKDPKVRIYPAALGGFWMEVMDLHLTVRVRQVK